MVIKKSLIIILLTLSLLNCQLVTRAPQLLQENADIDRDDAIFLLGGQPRTLDPAKTLGGPDGALGHIFSGLVMLDADLQVQPELAAGWEVSDDGLTYTFYLRKNVLFHDGRPFTAQDVIFSWERAANPDTGSDTVQTYLGDIAGIQAVIDGQTEQISGLRAIDDYTLEVQLTAPVVYFLQKLAYPVAFVVDSETVDTRNWEYTPNGTGPFRLRNWEDDEEIILVRNDSYYLEPARVRHVVYDLGPGLALAQYEEGDIDLVGVGGANLDRVEDPNNRLHDQLQLGISLCTSTIGLNTQIAPFDDVRVRQAFNYGLDKELLIDTFSGGDALMATGSLPPGMPGYTNDPGRGYPFNPVKANQLLDEAGYADRSTFPVLTYTTSGYGDVGGYVTAVISLWQETLGITIQPVVIDPFIYYDELYSGNAGNIYQSGWCADYPDPQNFLDILYHSSSRQNIGRYVNFEVDGLLEQARIEENVAARLAQYAEIERRIVADAPVVFVSHSLQAALISPDLDGYVLTPMGVRQWHRVSVDR
ncbi:ABC transporter substrate-binding protein [Candidatus Leptofilum sp.]|uniref:ABC transporter substrate-binding protein n=1 Tax=Candidatus Leptofilum sp. TaxID=3241576 RepID=UPI003B5AFD9F